MHEMRTPWQDRPGTTLSDLYDADLRATRSPVHYLAQTIVIPHPLPGVEYADGVAPLLTETARLLARNEMARASAPEVAEVHA